MPPKGKGKGGQKAKGTVVASSPSQAAPSKPPETVFEQSLERYYKTRPYAKTLEKSGLSGLSKEELIGWSSTPYLSASATSTPGIRSDLSNKGQKDLWKNANELTLPLRALHKPTKETWGKDRSGRDIADYSLEEYNTRRNKQLRLTGFNASHQLFLVKRNAGIELSAQDIQEERHRRAEINALRMELYGEPKTGSYAQDPAWDDVEPMPISEPEGALAAIAYPESYGEAIAYLRAVMAADERSPRCLRLTEDVISQNPAHYTVWLYRFGIIDSLKLPVSDEFVWLNKVAMENLKNYQIWHHRHLLVEYYFPQISGDREKVLEFSKSEMAFLTEILAEDTKNYHVWSYRQYLVRKLSYWTEDELRATEAFILQDVRNNSAWSHRFFLVFSDPRLPASVRTEREPADVDGLEGFDELDAAATDAIVDREIDYAEKQILKAPQNESPWNYLRGVLARAKRPLASVEAFAQQFAVNIGRTADEDIATEEVKSTHAMDLLARIFNEKGETAQAELYLTRLAEKWDPIRAGYWQLRKSQVGKEGEDAPEAEA